MKKILILALISLLALTSISCSNSSSSNKNNNESSANNNEITNQNDNNSKNNYVKEVENISETETEIEEEEETVAVESYPMGEIKGLTIEEIINTKYEEGNYKYINREFMGGKQTVFGLEEEILILEDSIGKIVDYTNIGGAKIALNSEGEVHIWGEKSKYLIIPLEEKTDVNSAVKLNIPKVKEIYQFKQIVYLLTYDGDIYMVGINSDFSFAYPWMETEDVDIIKIDGYNFNELLIGYHTLIGIKENGDMLMWRHGEEEVKLDVNYNEIEKFAIGKENLGYIKDGKVYTWERVWTSGQEDALYYDEYENNLEPKVIKGFDNVIDLKLGYSSSMLLTSDGDVYTWGNSVMGTLGLSPLDEINKYNTLKNSVNHTLVVEPTKVETLKNAKEIYLHEYVALVLTEDGLYGFGENTLKEITGIEIEDMSYVYTPYKMGN